MQLSETSHRVNKRALSRPITAYNTHKKAGEKGKHCKSCKYISIRKNTLTMESALKCTAHL